MKRLLGILFVLFSVSLYGLSYIKADGQSVFGQSRDYHFHHHSKTHDYSFFGTSRFAVRFNFRTAYPNYPSQNVYFNTMGARLWFPSLSDSAVVTLYSDVDGSPGSPIYSKKVGIDKNEVDVLFEGQYTAEAAWLFVDYNTNIIDRFVAASIGTGNSSYYMQQFGETYTLANFALNGFQAELLFGLLGEFVNPRDGLELKEISYEGNLYPGDEFFPRVKLYNHSSRLAENVSLRLVLSRPGLAQYATHYLTFPQNIQPYSYYEYFDDRQGFPLPYEATQLRIEARITSSLPESDSLMVNNSKTTTINVFQDEYPVMMVENFLRDSDSSSIRLAQERHTHEKIHALEYYPLLGDPFGNIFSMQRFNWYGFNSLPRTVFAGDKKIAGYNSLYAPKYRDLVETVDSYYSFINRGNCRLVIDEDTGNSDLEISLENFNTDLYSSQSSSPTLNSKFFVGIFARQLEEDGDSYYILKKWIAFADTINTAMVKESMIAKRYLFSTLGLGEEGREYRIYYWMQGNSGGKIHYANFRDFTLGHSPSSPETPADLPSLEAYPNPYRGRGELCIKSSAEGGELKVYNLKGQRVFTAQMDTDELRLSPNIFPSSGIYLLRYKDLGGRELNKKVSIIK